MDGDDKIAICYGAEIPEDYSNTTEGRDCNDNNSASWRIDSYYYDADGDTYHAWGLSNMDDQDQIAICYGAEIPEDYSSKTEGRDCDDNNESVNPGMVEICANGVDDDCDGDVDCDDADCADDAFCSACVPSETVLDEIPEGSLSTWSYVNTYTSYSTSEVVSSYDSTTAIESEVTGNTVSYCPARGLEKVYDVSGSSATTALKAYFEFTSDLTYYNFPFIQVQLLDEDDELLANHFWYGKDVVGGLYQTYIAADPDFYTEFPGAAGYYTMDLSVMGDIEYAKVKVLILNYVCIGTNSITFDHLVFYDGCPAEEPGQVIVTLSENNPSEVYQDEAFDFAVNVTCEDGVCGDVELTLDPTPTSIRMLIYNPNSYDLSGSVSCNLGGYAYGDLPYEYLSENGVEITYWCDSTVVDASVLENFDVLYLGRSRGHGYVNSSDLRDWVAEGGGVILESNGDNYEPGTYTYIWSSIYDIFGYENCPNIEMSDNSGGGPLTKTVEHPIWEGVTSSVGDNRGLYENELADLCIGSGTKIGSSATGEQNPMVNEFGNGRTYSGVELYYNVNEDTQRYFLNVVRWVSQGGKGVIPMFDDWTVEPFYTTDQNPTDGSYDDCLADMQEGDSCEVTWSVIPKGKDQSLHTFFALANWTGSVNGSESEHTQIRIIVPTCDDSILNGDETNVDCGGSCGGYWYGDACNENPSTCGDGLITGAEECDDGNTNDGDGCGKSCTVEVVTSRGGGSGGGCPYGTRYENNRCVSTQSTTPTKEIDDEVSVDSSSDDEDEQKDGGVEQFVASAEPEDVIEPVVAEETENDNLITGQVTGDVGTGTSLLWLLVPLGLIVIIGGVFLWKKK